MRRRASVPVLALALVLVGCKNEPSPVVLEKIDAVDQRVRDLEDRVTRVEKERRDAEASEAPPFELEAPRAATGGRLETKASIAIAKDGIRLNGDLVGPAELSDRLAAVRQANPAVALIVRADADVPHAKVVEILDLARTIGIERFSVAAFAGEPEPEPEPVTPPAK